MDPDATLLLLRELTDDIHKRSEDKLVDLTEQAENMATLFDALDKWLTVGGFFPEAWLVHQHGRGKERRRRSQ